MNHQRRHRIADAEWESHKRTIQRLYLEEDKNLGGPDGVMSIMETKYRFSASKAQFETRLKKWKFRKYSKRDEWLTLSHVLKKRRDEGKVTEVLFDDELVDPDRVRKETRRHRKHMDDHPYSQIQHLPSYITVRTPPLSHASPIPQARLSPSPVRFGNPSSFAMENFTFEALSPFQQSRAIGSQHVKNLLDPFSYQRHDFDSLWSTPYEELFDLNDFNVIYQPRPGNGTNSLSLPENGLNDDRLMDLNTVDSESGDLTVSVAKSSNMIIKDVCAIPDFLASIINSFSMLMPTVNNLVRRFHISEEDISKFPAERFCQPSTPQLLRQQSVDMQILHLITFRLVNTENVLGELKNPKTNVDKLYKAGVEYLFSLSPHLLNELFDSTALPYRMALQQGLFCVAIDQGVVQTVQTILKRGFDPHRLLNFEGHLRYPLQRACTNFHVEVARTLIKFGDDPEKQIFQKSLHECISKRSFGGKYPPELLDIISLLLNNGAMLNSDNLVSILQSGDPKLLPLLTSGCVKPGCEMLISNGTLAYLLQRGPSRDILTAIKAILDSDYPENFKCSEIWNRVLTISLSNAVLNGDVEAIDILVNVGAHPNSNCLIGAVRIGSIEIVERFLDLGSDPNAMNVPWSYRGLPEDMDLLPEEPKHTAISYCIDIKFREAFQAFKQRGFLSKVADSEDSFKLALTAACNRGYQVIAYDLLSLPKFDSTWNLHHAMTAASRTGQEAITRRLLAADIRPNHETLYVAVKTRQLPLVELLIGVVQLDSRLYEEAWCDILFEAVKWGNMTIIRNLIQAGISLNNRILFDPDDEEVWRMPYAIEDALESGDWLVTPLSTAILRGNSEVIELLLAAGAQLNVHDVHVSEDAWSWSLTALAASVAKQDLKRCRDLLSRGADPFDNSAIYLATVLEEDERGQAPRPSILKALLDAFTERYPCGVKSFGASALCWAIENAGMRRIRLLAMNTDPNCLVDPYHYRWGREELFQSPLGVAIMYYTEHGDSDALRILLQEGGDPNSIVYMDYDENSRITALLYAIELESIETVTTLIKAGANVALPAVFGIRRTPLQAAVEVGNEEIVAHILQWGADVNELPAARSGATALQLAAIKGYIGIAATLLERNADVNAEPAMLDGRTAFEGATEHGRTEMMLFLVQKGADLLSNDRRQYRRAIRFAEKNGQDAAKQFADQLFEAALRNEGTRTMETGNVQMTGVDIDSFSDFLSFSP